MPRASRKFETEEELYDFALKALMRRGHSVFEMRKALERRADDKALVRRVLDQLKEQNYLDDARYAMQFVRQRSENRRQGRHRIARELRARGVPDRHIDAALGEVLSGVDAAAQVRARIERKLRSLRAPFDETKLASLYGALLRAGFESDTIRRELRAITKQQVDTETLSEDLQ
ncbi:MAG: regulatory protein RecX [Acidobacteria bacterium]|nr:regulatory protein RecX [Acidobacteriota bacterium]MBI3663670.1 regulatory protein RecX [Acidobacteriota bacterium]